MKTPRLLALASLAASCLLIVAGTAQAQSCQPIQFERGNYSGTVGGIAPPEDVVCYEVRTGAAQRAEVSVKGRNVVFSIVGVVDAFMVRNMAETAALRCMVGCPLDQQRLCLPIVTAVRPPPAWPSVLASYSLR